MQYSNTHILSRYRTVRTGKWFELEKCRAARFFLRDGRAVRETRPNPVNLSRAMPRPLAGEKFDARSAFYMTDRWAARNTHAYWPNVHTAGRMVRCRVCLYGEMFSRY